MRASRQGLWVGAAIACGLFLAEDPVVIAVRQHLRAGGGAHTMLLDLALAVVMLGYNYAAVRYVVRVSSSAVVEQAIAELDDEHPDGGWGTRVVHGLNPFTVIKAVAERAASLLGRAGESATRRGRAAAGRLLGDLAVVNLLGVPGAGLRRTTAGRTVGADDAFRLSALFVGSWFAGAWLIEVTIDAASGWPIIGPVLEPTWHAIATTYAAITDVTTPLGATSIAVFTVAVARAIARVERRAARLAGSGPAP
jgi:hypothetical protein